MGVFQFLIEYLPFIAQGSTVTLQLTLFSFALGFATAMPLVMANLFGILPFRLVSRSYVEVVRGTPLLVQLFLIYFGLPSIGVKFDAMTASILALGLNSAAYQAEIFRSAIKGIPESQFLAAESLGFTKLQTFRYVVLPQAVRIALPALVNEFVTLIKESALASIIGIVEITRRADYVAAYTFRAFEAYLAAAIIYFVLCYFFSYGARYIEKKTRIPGYKGG